MYKCCEEASTASYEYSVPIQASYHGALIKCYEVRVIWKVVSALDFLI